MKRIFPLYLIREIIPTFLVSILVMTFMLLMTRVLELTELIVVRGVNAGTIFGLLALSLPNFLVMTIPMATLLAVLLAFMRMAGDNEIVVLKSAGVGLYQILPSVILFCLWTYLLTTYMTMVLVPSANRSFRLQLLALAKTRADVGIKEGVFNTGLDNMVLFVNHIPLGSDMMEDLFVQDKTEPGTTGIIVASRGRIAADQERRALVLQLFDGLIDRIQDGLKTSQQHPVSKIRDQAGFGRAGRVGPAKTGPIRDEPGRALGPGRRPAIRPESGVSVLFH